MFRLGGPIRGLDDAEQGPLRVAGDGDAADRGVERLSQDRALYIWCAFMEMRTGYAERPVKAIRRSRAWASGPGSTGSSKPTLARPAGVMMVWAAPRKIGRAHV